MHVTSHPQRVQEKLGYRGVQFDNHSRNSPAYLDGAARVRHELVPDVYQLCSMIGDHMAQNPRRLMLMSFEGQKRQRGW